MYVLPVSGTPVLLMAPSGQDEIILGEGLQSDPASYPGPSLRVWAVRRLAPPAAARLDWDQLPYADVDAALLALRRALLGDSILAEVECHACSAWGDIQLSVSAYLAANRPRRHLSRSAQTPPSHPFGPTVAEVLSAVEHHGPEQAAVRLETALTSGLSRSGLRRQRAALERAAPPLSGSVQGDCPHCGAPVSSWFDAGAWVLGELRLRAGSVLGEIHLLASAYGWSEEAILALPARRRSSYAERVQAERQAESWAVS